MHGQHYIMLSSFAAVIPIESIAQLYLAGHLPVSRADHNMHANTMVPKPVVGSGFVVSLCLGSSGCIWHIVIWIKITLLSYLMKNLDVLHKLKALDCACVCVCVHVYIASCIHVLAIAVILFVGVRLHGPMVNALEDAPACADLQCHINKKYGKEPYHITFNLGTIVHVDS